MQENIDEKLKRHNAFWKGEVTDRPLVGFQIGSYFVAKRYDAAVKILEPGKTVTPDQLNPHDFLADYERQYQWTLETGQDAFYVAEPFTAVPWMEGMLGCTIKATEDSMWAESWLDDWDKIKDLGLKAENPWYKKFMEFVDVLAKHAAGRFPIGQPILRGPSDMVGAVIGQSKLPLEMYYHPEQIKELAAVAADALIKVVDTLQKQAPPFYGGYSFGFYHLWTPGHCIWFQEDLTALLSPRFFRQLILESDEKICRYADYTAIHLHPSSFFLLNDILKIRNLGVVEINKDIGCPPVSGMLKEFRQVLGADKKLIIWGSLDKDDLLTVMKELPRKNIYLNIVTETVEEAKELMSYLKSLV